MSPPSTEAQVASPVERQVAFDMVRRSLPAIPVVVVAALVLRGAHGALSAAFAIALVLANLVVAAMLLAWAARISLACLMAAALGGFVVRMGLVLAVMVVAGHQSWADMPTLGITLVVTHLGLLAWETRYVSVSLAFPGLRPAATRVAPDGRA